ncbi:hypothetical protein AWV80_28290 [Cupriavidus sp. UYMU48A]|nr:hypothetical protein AWV80_28290 [Cupriavidus sp. UYMU48A]
MQTYSTSNTLLSAIAAAAALSLAACGGGGGDDGGTNAPAAVTPPPAPPITTQGTAPAVTADPLAVVFVPHTETATRAVLQSIAHAAFPTLLQKATSEGAFTQIGIDAASLITLSGGKVVDVAGNGDFAIGRWTDGSSSIGNVSVNQGDHYAVGKPLKLLQNMTLQSDLSVGPKLACTAMASTSPTAVSGNFAPGRLNSASAVIDMGGPFLQAIYIDVSVGSDAHATASVSSTILNGVTQSNGVLQHVQTFGTLQSSPYLAFGYAMSTPNSGDVTGVVVLRCH